MENTANIKVEFAWTIDRSVALENEMHEKVVATLSKFEFDYMNVKLEIKKDGQTTFAVRAILELPRYKTIVLNAEDNDVMNAFDKVKHMLFDEAKKAKTIKRSY
ncbi:hypothetical protein [Ureaplasma ceti]|uniref:Ribosomal subunit interface protein n=1 Tax=Ureaplasma ceti TaxID=3119530 RepID=A0ABP9U670_9BACT